MAAQIDNLESVNAVVGQGSHIPQEDMVDIWEMLAILGARWRTIALISLAGLAVGAVVALIIRPSFTAKASILPPQQQSSSANALMGQIGALAGLATGGSSSALGLKNPADMYIGILESRTIADEIINQFHLKSVFKTRTMVDTRAALTRHVTFESGKDNLIHISVTTGDPKLSSALANAYVDSLYRMNSTLAIGEAAQRRVFFDQQLAEEKEALSQAEEAFRKTEETTGVIQLSGQAATIIREIADTRAQISSREVELQAMRTFATQENPDAIRLEQEIASLHTQLAQLENSQRGHGADFDLPAGRMPGAGLEYERKQRDLRYHETLYELLSRQYEAARIDEAKSAPIIQVVDHAVPPDKKSGPPRTLLTVGFGLLGFCIASLWILLRDKIGRMRRDPLRARKVDRLAEVFRH